MRFRLCLAILITFSAQILFAQDQAALTGRVLNQEGAAVAAVTVTAINTDTGMPYPAKTNQAGAFTITSVPPGPYQVKWEAAGFKTMVRSGLSLETAQSLELNVRMTPGSPTEVVATDVAAMNTNIGVGQLIGQDQVDNVAVESRKAASTAKISSDVVFKTESGIENTPSFTVAGGRSQNQNWKLDGGSGQDNALGNPQNMLNPPSESLQEFKIESNSYSAEYGRAAGGMVVMTTKSGTDRYHGSAYEYLRNDITDARTFFSPSVAELRWNTFGSSLGGPILKKKTFFFFNWESGRKVTGNTFSGNTVPTPAEASGNFFGIKGLIIRDPLNGQPFTGNVIPATRIDRVGKEIAGLYPAPNQSYDASLPDSNNYTQNANTNLRQDSFTFRLDHNFSAKDKMTLRWTYIYTAQNVGSYFPASEAFADPQAMVKTTQMYNGAFSYAHTFSPSLVNEVRFGYSNHAAMTKYSQIHSGENAKLGITGPVDPTAFPYITVAGYTSMGATKQFRDRGPSLTINPSDNVTWTHGKHSVKFGGEWRFSYNIDRYQQQPGGEFDFSAVATGNALAALLMGQVYSANVITAPLLAGRIDIFGAYVQDKYQVSQRLTLNLGLRWETEGPRWDKNNIQSGFNPTTINPVSNTPGIIVFDGINGVSRYSNQWQYKLFAPRAGFAYRLASTWALRGGFGIFYDGEYGTNSTSRILTTGFGTNATFQSPDNGTTPAFLFANGMPAAAPITYTPGYGAVPVGGKPNTSPDYVAWDHKFGYSEQWNIGIQHDLTRTLSFEASYIGNMGHRLSGQQLDTNEIPLTCDITGCHGPAKQSQTLRPFPQFSHVYQEAPAFGASTYNAMRVKLERKFKTGVTVLANYTWAKFLDNIAGGDDLNGAKSAYQSMYLRKLDKSYAGSDVPQTLIINAAYRLPFGKGVLSTGTRFGDSIIGGWGLSGTLMLRSGVPYGITDLSNTANTYSASQRPNITCDPQISNFSSTGAMLSKYFNTSCFQAPAAGYFGNAARNVGFGPGFSNADLSLDKQWNFRERYNLQFRTDFYNVTNHANFANPITTLGSGNFGTINAIALSSVARELQFGLKLKF